MTPADARLFGEEPSRIVVSFEPDARAEVERICAEHGVPFTGLGVVGGDRLTVDGLLEVPVAELAEAHRTALDEIVGAD